MNTVLPKTIFLVDDDPVTNFIHTKIIQGNFPLVVTAFTYALDALNELKKLVAMDPHFMPDFIFLDINMPRMDGWEFLDEVQKLPAEFLKSCMIIMVSSSLDREDIERSKSYPSVHEFISKPLTVQMIKHLVLQVDKNSFVEK